MSIYGSWVAATIAADAFSSAAVDVGRDYDYLSVELPGMTTCKLYLQVAELLAGTYYDLGKETTTDLENFGRADVWRLGGWRYIKVVSTVAQSEEVLIRVRGMRY